MLLSNLISVKKRYTRSINLERDLEITDSLAGYIPTNKCVEVLNKFINAYESDNSIRAWTITGVYGSGKSAFAHFLTALCAPNTAAIKAEAIKILNENENTKKLSPIFQKMPKTGLIRATVTAQREPVSHTLLKAVHRGTKHYSSQDNKKHTIIKKLEDALSRINNDEIIENKQVISLVKEVTQVFKTDILLIIDELGKNLEYTSKNQSIEDLYILQQLAELPADKSSPKIFVIGILHQSFSDYLFNLNIAQKNEWAKIQGRFEDISFVESSEQIIKLIGKSIVHENQEKNIGSKIIKWASSWKESLKHNNAFKTLEKDDLKAIYPLHPISAVTLPILCYKYAQNDRTLFTFLASNEPHSFLSFLNDKDYSQSLPVLKLYHLYDYFVETAQILTSSRPNFQRWVEIQARITDARSLDSDYLKILKTVGILNLTSLSGSLKASREFVVFALCDNPLDKEETSKWNELIDDLINQGFITWRKQINEIRIWEGSSFDIEKELSSQIESIKVPLAELLNQHFPLSPIIAQKHSYKTGTLRYFERHFFDNPNDLKKIKCKNKSSDGLICYWLGSEEGLIYKPDKTENNKPIIIICAGDFNILKQACIELAALKAILNNASEFQLDGVARKEIKQRIFIAKQTLEKSLENSFDFVKSKLVYFVNNERRYNGTKSLNSVLSEACNLTYTKGITLWNELINRRELTSQGAKARNELIQAMLENYNEENLGITGYGPEFSIYRSLLFETQIHKFVDGKWRFYKPINVTDKVEVLHAWDAIEDFCLSAKSKPRQLDELYKILELPPYGIKSGLIPILLTAVLLKNEENISIYQDEVFIPKLGMAHFELLLKNESRFSVKNVDITGKQRNILNRINEAIGDKNSKGSNKTRNITLLNTIKPLIRLIKTLPQYSVKTNTLSKEALQLREAILEAREPDKLLFKEVPAALGFEKTDDENADKFICKFKEAIDEIKSSYTRLLETCHKLISAELSIQGNEKSIRDELLHRSKGLFEKASEPWLTRFLLALSDSEKNQQGWLESVIMIVSDKPAESWNDDDLEEFKTKLTDISRRFLNFEAIHKEISDNNNGNKAKKIIFTDAGGKEVHRIIWLDENNAKEADKYAEKLLKDISQQKSDRQFKQALIASLIDKIFEPEAEKVH